MDESKPDSLILKALASLQEQVRLLTLEIQTLSMTTEKTEAELRTLQMQVARNQSTLESQGAACDKMSNHIDFVDNVYDRVRHPLSYISSLVGGTRELPARNTDTTLLLMASGQNDECFKQNDEMV